MPTHRHSFAARVTALAGSSALAACSLTTSFTGLEGSAQTDAASDAALADGSASDATTLVDAAQTGNDSGQVDSGPTFCSAGKHAFCDDFEGGNLGTLWGGHVDALGSTTLSTTRSTSPSTSMHATMGRRTKAGDLQDATIDRELMVASPTAVRLAFQVYLDGPAWQQNDINCALMELDFVGATTDTFYLVAGPTYWQISTPTGMYVDLTSKLGKDRWNQLVVVVSATGAVSITANGVAVDANVGRPLASNVNRVRLRLGIVGYNVPAPAFSAYFDDAAVDVN